MGAFGGLYSRSQTLAGLAGQGMRTLFWLCLAGVGYAYCGYAAVLAVLARLRPRPFTETRATPTITIVLAARNEMASLPAKIENLQRLRYPRELVQIVVASDGSTDGTNDLLVGYGVDLIPVLLRRSVGKAAALNEAVRRATGDILVFLDVRQTLDTDAVTELVAPFADAEVGAVSGELLLEASSEAATASALGIYWKIEKMVRKLESATGSVVGVTGAIYAVRRELYTEIPAGTVLDDVYVPMHVVRRGKRVVFQPSAIARDRIFAAKGKEFSRKVRTLSGNYQLLRLAPWLLSPENPLLFRFISHKLLRLLVPLLLALLLVASLLSAGTFYRASFLLQVLFYSLAALGALTPSARRYKPIAIANTFVMLNAAATLAFCNFIRRRESLWTT